MSRLPSTRRDCLGRRLLPFLATVTGALGPGMTVGHTSVLLCTRLPTLRSPERLPMQATVTTVSIHQARTRNWCWSAGREAGESWTEQEADTKGEGHLHPWARALEERLHMCEPVCMRCFGICS